MTNEQIKEKIESLNAIIERYKDNPNEQKIYESSVTKRDALIAKLQAAPVEPEAAPVPMPTQEENGGANAAILATLTQLMLSGGGGADSFEIRKMIEDELAQRKISLDELDESVLSEIRKNQRVTLAIPKFDLVIEMSKDDANIPHIYEMIDDVLAGNNIYLIGDAGSGKAQPMHSRIATPNGWVTMGEIKSGDSVFAADGTVKKVISIHDNGEKDIYRVHFQDGTYADCCDEHLWAVTNNLNKSRGKGYEIKPLKDFKDNLFRGKAKSYNYTIPLTNPVQYKASKHMIHPYVLGVLIGDGCMVGENVTITNPDKFIIDKVAKLLPSNIELNKVKSDNKCDTYILRIKDRKLNKKNPIKEELTRLGLMQKLSINKFIPNEYLFDSIENRKELFLGLNDTDGTCSLSKSTYVEYSTSSESLAKDYQELVQSLGGVCKIKQRIPYFKDAKGIKKSGHISYRLAPKLNEDIQMFSLPRKENNFKHQTKYKPIRTICNVEYLGKMDCRCISIHHKNHLYLTDNYIVTHNTYGSEQLAKILNREMTTINCSQYTSPAEIIGGQTIEGYKDGKLVLAWEKGKILLLDEMPKLDPNTAGLLNDALAKSSKTKPDSITINSANPDQPPIKRNKNFAVIATGNIYPNTSDARVYVGNNQQDLSLMDRFSGSVYYVNYDNYIDQKSCRYDFLFNMLVGNYYEYMDLKQRGETLPEPKGLRTVLESTNLKNMALTSYRTLTAFRVAFEYELIRAMANKGKPKSEQIDITKGKTVLKAWHSYLVAFTSDAKKTLISTTKFTDAFVVRVVKEAIDKIVNGGQKGFTEALCPALRENAEKAFTESEEWLAAMKYVEPIPSMTI